MKTLVATADNGPSKYAALMRAMKNVIILPKNKALALAKTKPIVYNEFD